MAITTLESFKGRNAEVSRGALAALQKAAVEHENTFETMIEAAKVCTLGAISEKYVRGMRW